MQYNCAILYCTVCMGLTLITIHVYIYYHFITVAGSVFGVLTIAVLVLALCLCVRWEFVLDKITCILSQCTICINGTHTFRCMFPACTIINIRTCIDTCIHVPVDAPLFTFCFPSSIVQLYQQQALSQEEDSIQWDTRGSDNEGSGDMCWRGHCVRNARANIWDIWPWRQWVSSFSCNDAIIHGQCCVQSHMEEGQMHAT